MKDIFLNLESYIIFTKIKNKIIEKIYNNILYYLLFLKNLKLKHIF